MRIPQLLEEVNNQLLHANGAKLFVACSGGKDSMALCHVLLKLNMKFSVAHVNFQLRGEESNGDETFVKEFARKNQLPFFVFKPVQSNLIRRQHEGIQEWARRVRYHWFERLLNEESGDFMLLAHHQQDQAETILHQFFRGGGLTSLSGMQARNGRLLRPMLHVKKEDIDAFVVLEKIKWREDSSNDTNDYTRNFLRHEVLPRISEINPDIANSLDKRAIWFREADVLLNTALEHEIRTHVLKSTGKWILPLEWLKTFDAPRSLFWKILEPVGFKSAQVEEAMFLLESDSGRFIESPEARLWKDRDQLILEFAFGQSLKKEIEISEAPFQMDDPIRLMGEWLDISTVQFSDERNSIFLDMEEFSWPLVIRPWREGDRFYPFGMKGQKKVSDLLIQQKVSVSDKRGVFVLCSGDTILWVIGLRAAEQTRISKTSGQILKLTFETTAH
jgi:tRNA(Ile)-lysidine synthase